jgi:hypothetical protein
MALPLSPKSAPLGGHGACSMHQTATEQTTATNGKPVNTTVIDTSSTAYDYFTGRVYENYVVQISSGFSVDDAGALTGTLETTGGGPETENFLQKFAPAYYDPDGTSSEDITLTDETGRTITFNRSAGRVDKQLVAIRWGGPFLETKTEDGVWMEIIASLVSIGNSTLTDSYAANTFKPTTFNLIGHKPKSDIKISFAFLKQWLDDNPEMGIELVRFYGDVTELVLPKGHPKATFFIEVKERVEDVDDGNGD